MLVDIGEYKCPHMHILVQLCFQCCDRGPVVRTAHAIVDALGNLN
jgi:hypothetical protein